MPALNKEITVPANIQIKLQILEQDLKEEDITVKGYCKQKWSLLRDYAPQDITTKIKQVQNLITRKEIDEKDAYHKMLELLQFADAPTDSIKVEEQGRKVLSSTENLPMNTQIEEQDLAVPGCSTKPPESLLKNMKITNFFTKTPKTFKTPEKSSQNTNQLKENLNKRKSSNSDESNDKKIKMNSQSHCIINNEINLTRTKPSSNRCFICKQYLDSPELLVYNGHPNDAVDEFVALTDSKLLLFTGNESEINSQDARPHNKVTHYSVYDKQGHLCSIDAGLIENNAFLYFSGYLKPIYDENSSPQGGIPTKDIGPINEWWVSGFDGGEKAVLGFSTAFGEYYLMEPSPEYLPLIKPLREKIYMSKLVIEFLLKESWQNPSYEDLLNHLQNSVPPEDIGQLSEEDLLRHAQFICDQVTSFDAAAEDDDDLLIVTPCMRTLVKLSGVTFSKRKAIRREEQKEVKLEKNNEHKWSKATTTDLVREVFESFFPEQLDKTKEQLLRRKRCGVCATCQLPDCGKCSKCMDKAKFGGKGKSKQACVQRRCPNLAIQDADDSDNDQDEDEPLEIRKPPTSSKRVLHPVKWTSDPVASHAGRTYYHEALVGDIKILAGDCVLLYPDKPGTPLLIARVAYMWDEPLKKMLFHAHVFCRGSDTILGETSDTRELFLVDECEVCPLGSIIRKVQVEKRLPDPNWALNGGLHIKSPQLEDDGRTFFYQKRYDRKSSRFEDLHEEIVEDKQKLGYKPCDSCRRKLHRKTLDSPVLKEGVVHWRNEIYKNGCGVYLLPGTFEFKTAPILHPTKPQRNEPIDEEIYPEFYRKKSDGIYSASTEHPEPFCIGYIVEILSAEDMKNGDDIEIKVQKLYRPENTHKGITLSQQLDLNILYWSEEQLTIKFSQVAGRCHIAFADVLELPVQEWSLQGPNRFYFMQSYNVKTQEFEQVGVSGNSIGRQGKGKGTGKGKSKKALASTTDAPEDWPKLERPLRTMDVFAGCGGLSEGLHQSGVADTKWAIEKEEVAAHAFKLNNPNTVVYSEDCNQLLTQAMSGATETDNGQPLPTKGDVELLCGGPPCQGFSGMNRFNAGQYSLFKNSLIVSYLSYCDYYRPKYFILENVRNFVIFKKAMVLKLTLRCLLAMGYQCTFGILQAGNYGVPQTRRRLIIFAAAPGEILPHYPEPTHVFNKRATQLNVVVDSCKYNNGSKWLSLGAPYRTITVRDAMSDLPEICNGSNTLERPYDSEPTSHFQRMIRDTAEQPVLRDHICKEMAPIVEARMTHIPTASGSDWRDLPNLVIRLSDGNNTNKLRYDHHDKKNGRNSKGGLRGVCSCASAKACDPSDRQYNTLIPWCLPHTANRHYNWVGLYGRLNWDGVFATTVTNPEPMGKQGKVLHPEQHRVVSVRECARSQGFPDRYRFYGNVMDKHRQVGNAVPPPLGAAIGREILAAVIKSKLQNDLNDY